MSSPNQNNKKQALGKGLSALLENAHTDITSKYETDAGKTVGAIAHIRVAQIEANPFQPRTHFEKEALAELVESIKAHGIIQPITVRKIDVDKYQLISGERRFKASKIIGLDQIPAYIRVANDQGMLEMALIENIQRQDLDAIEIALSFKRLIEECSLTQDQLSEKVGKQRSTVTNYLRLLKLPEEIQLGIRNKKITMGHARALVNIDDPETQLTIFNRIVNENLSVRDVEDIARWQNKKPESLKRYKKRYLSATEDDAKILSGLKDIFNADVSLKRQTNGKGKIIVNFKSETEFKRIVELFELL